MFGFLDPRSVPTVTCIGPRREAHLQALTKARDLTFVLLCCAAVLRGPSRARRNTDSGQQPNHEISDIDEKNRTYIEYIQCNSHDARINFSHLISQNQAEPALVPRGPKLREPPWAATNSQGPPRWLRRQSAKSLLLFSFLFFSLAYREI